MKNLLKKKSAPYALGAAVLALFWMSGLHFSIKQNGQAYAPTDGTSEQIVIFSAYKYLELGFFSNKLLPTYPPFGEDGQGRPRTEPFVYNHYIAGSDLTLALWLKLFGKEALWAARMIPHSLSTIAMGCWGMAFAVATATPWLGFLALLTLLLPRSFAVWTTCYYGHSYVTAWLVLFIALVIADLARNKKKQASIYIKHTAWLYTMFGFMVPFYALDWALNAPILGLAVGLFFANTDQQQWGLSYTQRQGRLVAVAIYFSLGLLLAALYQTVVSSLYFGSLSGFLNDTAHWLQFRKSGIIDGIQIYIDHPMSRVLREFNKQAYGATGMTAYNWMAITTCISALAYWGRAISRRHLLGSVAAVVLSYLSSASWSLIMKSHSMGNIHFTSRHYFSLFLACSLVLLYNGTVLAKKSRLSTTITGPQESDKASKKS
jgi:hypothetical protein